MEQFENKLKILKMLQPNFERISDSQLFHDEFLDKVCTFCRTAEEEEPAEVGGEGEGDGTPGVHR
jgi:hypothetical protein